MDNFKFLTTDNRRLVIFRNLTVGEIAQCDDGEYVFFPDQQRTAGFQPHKQSFSRGTNHDHATGHNQLQIKSGGNIFFRFVGDGEKVFKLNRHTFLVEEVESFL